MVTSGQAHAMTAQTGTLAPHVHRYLRERRSQGTYSPKSLASVVGRLDSFAASFGRRPVHHLNRQAVERWLQEMPHLATSSRSSYLSSVRTFTAWLVEHDIVSSDPCAGIPPIRRPRSIPRAQSAAAVAAVLAECVDDRDRVIVWLMVGLGLRRVEVSRARWEDYDPEAQTLLVHGKGDHERFLPVPAEVARAMGRVRERGNTGPIVRTRQTGRNGGVTPEWVGQRVSILMRRAGVKSAPYDGVSAHALRHTAASDVLDRCGDLRVVQAMLGHQHLTSTSIYLRRANLGQMRDAMEGRTYLRDAA